jgi:hypothetical protein
LKHNFGSNLRITSRGNCISFQKHIGFRYKPKIEELAKICTVCYTQKTYLNAKKLYAEGLSYAEITRQLGVKDGWTIKEWVTGLKTPYAAKFNW